MSVLLRSFEFAVALFVLTQVIFPLIEGIPLFPLLRGKKTGRLLRDIEHASQDLGQDALRSELDSLKNEHADQAKAAHDRRLKLLLKSDSSDGFAKEKDESKKVW